MTSDYSYSERILIAPSSKSFWRVRVESTLEDTTQNDSNDDDLVKRLTPFPQEAHEFLQRHNATSVILQVGTSASTSYDSLASNSFAGPSGVLVRASLHKNDDNGSSASLDTFQALLRDLVGRRILLVPFFSIHIQRLHRHVVELFDDDTTQRQFEIVLPMEGAALSSEGMKAFQMAFSPCRNESGILSSWNSPKVMSELIVNRESSERHGIWLKMTKSKKEGLTRVTKGLQFYRSFEESNDKISLAKIFPDSKRHRLCPFIDQSTLEVVTKKEGDITLEQEPIRQYTLETPGENNSQQQIQVFNIDPMQWKEPYLSMAVPKNYSTNSNSLASIQQTIQRPRGVSYKGTFITQLTMTPPENCPLTAHVEWFVPPIVQPTWQSFQVTLEDTVAQTEQILDWRRDLNGTILTTDKHIRFIIPSFHAASSQQQQILTVRWDYQPAFLSFEHFPGDANRGVEIPPAVVKLTGPCLLLHHQEDQHRLYSSSLLILPPVPDMSMPFNVISMTCSLYAFIIGSLLNLLIRKSSERIRRTYDPSLDQKNKQQGKLALIKGKIKALLGKKKTSMDDSVAREGESSEEETDVASSEAPKENTN